MTLDPLDPSQIAVTAEQRRADQTANLDRRVSALERGSLNAVGQLVANVVGIGATIPHNADTFAPFGLARVDTHEAWNAGDPTKLVAPRPGTYIVCGTIALNPSASGFRSAWLNAAGSIGDYDPASTLGAPPTSASWSANLAAVVPLGEGDFVRIGCYQNSGGGLSVAYSELSFVWVGPQV